MLDGNISILFQDVHRRLQGSFEWYNSKYSSIGGMKLSRSWCKQRSFFLLIRVQWLRSDSE